MKDAEQIFDWALIALSAAFIVWVASMTICTGIAEKKCLDLGYPKTSVTYDYTAYCLTIDGVVRAKVEKLK